MTDLFYWGILAALATTLGGAVPLSRRKWSHQALHALMATGSGILLGASFLHIIPASLEANEVLTGVGLSLAFLVIFGLEQFTLTHACPEYEDCPVPAHAMGATAFAALLVHSFFDGVAMAAGFGVSVSLGLIASLAVIVHEFPEGLCSAGIFLGAGYSRKKSFLLTQAIAWSTPVGALISYLWIVRLPHSLLALVLGFSAGSFIYVGASDILPRLHRERNVSSLFFLTLGFLLMFLGTALHLG